MGEPLLTDDSDACWICPALRLPAGQFDVYEKPTKSCPFDPETGFRYAGPTPVCVHPYKVGLPPGRYASLGEPVPALPPRPSRTEERAAPEVPVYPGPPVRQLAASPTGLDDAAILAGERPQVPDELMAWMRGLLADAAPDDLAVTLEQAEEAARHRFPSEQVVEALRRVLSGA